MNCKDNLSCTFLDVFFFIVDKTHFNKTDYEEYKINPNTYLEISRLNRKFLITFTQIYKDSEQIRDDKVHLIEEAYKNYQRHQVNRKKTS